VDIQWAYDNLNGDPSTAPNPNALFWWRFGKSCPYPFSYWVKFGGRVLTEVSSRAGDERDEAAVQQTVEYDQAKQRVAELEAKVANLEKDLQEERAKIANKLEQVARDVRLKLANELKQLVKEAKSAQCVQKPGPELGDAGLSVAVSQKKAVVITQPNRTPQVVRSLARTQCRIDPIGLTTSELPLWREIVAKARRKGPLSLTQEEAAVYIKYGPPQGIDEEQS
jgi:hypothetical protein